MERAPARIRAVSFDGDGTLWEFDRVMRGALQAVLDELARVAGPSSVRGLSVDSLKHIRDTLAARESDRALDHHGLRRESFAVLLHDLGLYDDALHARLCDRFFEHRYASLTLYEDARTVLPTLRRRFRVALISNGNSDPKRFGLDRHFDAIVFAEAFGAAKPDPGIFAETLRRLGCAPEEMVHVGDSLDNDVAGAQAAGIFGVWLNRSQADNDTAVRPDATITQLHELAALVEKPA